MNQPGFEALGDQMILDFGEATFIFGVRQATDQAIAVQQAIRMRDISKIHLVAILDDYRGWLSCESILRGLFDQSKITRGCLRLWGERSGIQ